MERTDTGKQRRRTMGTLNVDPFANGDSKARYEAYSKLQASAVAFGVSSSASQRASFVSRLRS